MAASGYVADTFVAGEQPTVSKWNELWGNDASFNSGAGFNDGIIINRHLATSSVTASNIDFATLGQPARAYWAAGQASYTSTTPKIVKIDTASYDPGSNLNLSSNAYVAPVAGYYLVIGQVNVNSGSNNGNTQAQIYVNGVAVIAGPHFNGTLSANIPTSVSDIIQLSQGDLVTLYVVATSAWGIVGGSTATFLSVAPQMPS